MKRFLYLLFLVTILAPCAFGATDLGASSFSSWIKMIGAILCPVGFMISGLLMMKNKHEGADRLSGVTMGVFIFCGAGSIYSLISSWVS